jgi:hypothetical protein
MRIPRVCVCLLHSYCECLTNWRPQARGPAGAEETMFRQRGTLLLLVTRCYCCGLTVTHQLLLPLLLLLLTAGLLLLDVEGPNLSAPKVSKVGRSRGGGRAERHGCYCCCLH